MIRKRRAVVGTAALSAAVMAVTPATATARADGQADGGRAWRVVDTRPHPGGDGLLAVAASGRRNGWVFGEIGRAWGRESGEEPGGAGPCDGTMDNGSG